MQDSLFCMDQGFLETCLASDITERKEPKSSLRIYTKEQLKLFLHAVHEDPYAHRLEFLLALFCGLRPGEILGLTYNNFDSSTQTLNIHKQYTKDGRLPSESADSIYSCKKLEGDRYRSFQIPDFVCEELVLRQEKICVSFAPIRIKRIMITSASAAVGK